MFAKEGNQYLFENLKKLGFKGSKKDLITLLKNADKISELNMLKIILDSFKKNNNIDKEKINNVYNFILKCFDKYNEKYLDCSNNIEEPALHFYSLKNNNKFQITFYFFDDSTRISNGFHGEIGVRVLYGYEDRRKEKYIIFKEKEKYNDNY